MPPTAPRSYRTVAGPARAEIEVRRSRFVCDVTRAADEEAARAFIEQVRAGSREARHHCTAFVVGPTGATARSNDDGEPSGTAGAPMLEVLRGRGLRDVVAVVTRWFGGTLLGTGGLIRAYGDAVTAALEVARPVTRTPVLLAGLDVDHAEGPRIEHALRAERGLEVGDVVYGPAGQHLVLGIEADAVERVRALVAELTSGRGRLVDTGTGWRDRLDAPGAWERG